MKWNPAEGQLGFVLFISCFISLGGLLFGFNTAVISGAIPFIQKQFSMPIRWERLLFIIALLGAALGAFISGSLATRFGRRTMLLWSAWLFLIGTLSVALSFNLFWLMSMRFAVGIAIGIASIMVPIYIAEISPPQHRGALVSINQLLITLGILSAYLINFDFAGTYEWRFILGCAIVPSFFFLIGVLFSPESPRWLMLQGLEQHAERVLKLLRGNKNIHYELQSIQETLTQQKRSWRYLFKISFKPALTVCFLLAVLQQFCGINVIIYYAPIIFHDAGLPQQMATVATTLGVGLVNVLATVSALFLIDLIGRRPLLIIGTIGMLVGLFMIGLSFNPLTQTMLETVLTISGILIFIIAFAISLGPILWLMIAELFPLEIRGFSAGIAGAITWLANIVVLLSFFLLKNDLTPTGIFFVYGIISLLGFFFVYFKAPETKGESLEQIERRLTKLPQED